MSEIKEIVKHGLDENREAIMRAANFDPKNDQEIKDFYKLFEDNFDIEISEL